MVGMGERFRPELVCSLVGRLVRVDANGAQVRAENRLNAAAKATRHLASTRRVEAGQRCGGTRIPASLLFLLRPSSFFFLTFVAFVAAPSPPPLPLLAGSA